MQLLTAELRATLLANGQQQRLSGTGDDDFAPVVKLFTPDANATWLLTELDPHAPDIAFGLCDLGVGFPEIGSVLISELEAVRGPFGFPVERDLHWQARGTMSAYMRAAFKAGCIVQLEKGEVV